MFSGSLVAIVTPMTADGALDWPAWDRLLDFHVREGSDGIVVAGTTGESPVLSPEEVEELTRRAVHGLWPGPVRPKVGWPFTPQRAFAHASH